jgi:uncharacterized membrane protein (DUF4010 family)
LPHWIAVGSTVAAVLLFAGRARLHAFARGIEMQEIVTAGEFLLLTGLVLPLLPDRPVTALTTITPHKAWLALLVVCTLSYASYLAQRYVPRAASGLWMAALGGLYSSTATTVVLARRAGADRAALRQSRAGITLATGIMYLRVLIVVAVFNLALAKSLLAPLVALSLAGLAVAGLQYRFDASGAPGGPKPMAANRNPLELGPAALFAALFVAISVVSTWVIANFGISGIYALAAVVGVTDIDPFVLNLAQGGITGASHAALAAAILIAASSNNLLKAGYAVSFAGWRGAGPSAAALVALAAAGVAVAIWTGGA